MELLETKIGSDDEKLFCQTDPLGYHVTLFRETYEQHILESGAHTNVKAEDIEASVTSPQIIIKTTTSNYRNMYYAQPSPVFNGFHLRTIVDVDNTETMEAHVVTSYYAKSLGTKVINMEEGGLLYANLNRKL